jgi:hypothetical protein
MKRMTLFEANSFLHDPVRYREYLVRTVATSTAIETGESAKSIGKRLARFLDQGLPPLTRQRPR